MSGSIGVEPRERLVPCSRSAAGDFFISGEHLFPWHRQIRKVKRLSRRTCRHKVQYYETDQMGIVHHSNYIRWFEEARTDLMDQIGFGYEEMEERGILSPVLSVEADYLRMVHFGDTVTIETHIQSYNGIKLTVAYEVIGDKTGMVHCRGTSKHCFINRDGRPLSLMPQVHGTLRKAQKVQKSNATFSLQTARRHLPVPQYQHSVPE